ncbi:MAG: hypothetical protein PHZ04_04750 [Patescibacteria group bacterium]|nr:hypothetical protein [Patescibacteria group bacterium]MDD5294578.1 hypothetical protein [Patescibacteria group bacterium]MDD5554295.1 hypothetical protein [Patescibacteria group bacterium]
MAHVVSSYLVGCSGCDAKVLVITWSCGCVQVVNPNSGAQDEKTFGHFENCKSLMNRVLFTGFERLCTTKMVESDKNDPKKHPDT